MFVRTDKNGGFTLIELIVFIVIVSVGLAGVLASLNVSVKSSADPLQPKQALAIAEAMLEEVLLKEYAPPSGAASCTAAGSYARNCFDDVTDFDNYGNGVTGIYPIGGVTVISGLANYSVLVTVTEDNLLCTNSKTIVVQVTPPSGTANRISLTGYRCQY